MRSSTQAAAEGTLRAIARRDTAGEHTAMKNPADSVVELLGDQLLPETRAMMGRIADVLEDLRMTDPATKTMIDESAKSIERLNLETSE